jgi:hypothetical protein
MCLHFRLTRMTCLGSAAGTFLELAVQAPTQTTAPSFSDPQNGLSDNRKQGAAKEVTFEIPAVGREQ